jgi:hypothetical protein
MTTSDGIPMSLSEYQQGYWVPPPPPPRKRHTGGIISTVVILVLAATSLLYAFNRQWVADQLTVWQFTPTAVLNSYMERSTMTDHAEFLFEASRPVVTGAEKFNSVCTNEEPGSGVLGCYDSGKKKITLFDVTDDRLDGLEDVVAAHEMLHAAWDRMGAVEQAQLTTLLEAEAAKLADDPEFADTMAFYAKTEPGERDNELHSIIGTEVAHLAPALEKYYGQYFSNRAALVALHEKSNAVFVSLANETKDLVKQIDDLRTAIDADYQKYNSGYDQLNSDVADFNNRANNGGFSSQEEFDQERAALIARQQALDALYASIVSRNATYEKKVEQLSQLNAQAAALNTAINVVPRNGDGVN